MIIEICVVIAVVIFAVLAYVTIQTQLALQKTLRTLDIASLDFLVKLQNLESVLRTISNVGEITESETDRLKALYKRNKEFHPDFVNKNDLAEWIALSIKLGSKFCSRR